MAIERIHYGTAPIESLEGIDIFRRDKLSYARFLYELPRIISSKFPVERTYAHDTYRLEIGKVKVAADLHGSGLTFPWIDEDAYVSSKRQCIDNAETLSYNLDGEVRIYKNDSLKESCYRHLFQIPAMTSTGSFIIKGEEKALKAERSLDGTTYMACGELLRAFFKQLDFAHLSLKDIAEETNGKSISSFEFSSVSNALSKFLGHDSMIPVNGTNPYSMISTKTAIISAKNTGVSGQLKGATMDLRDSGYNLLDFLFLSFTEKKEGAKLRENFNESIGFEIGKDNKPLIPVHPVITEKDENGKIHHIVSTEIVQISSEDLAPLGNVEKDKEKKGKTIADYMAPGTEITDDCSVMNFAWEAVPISGRREIDLYGGERKGEIKTTSGKVQDIGYPDYVPVRPGNISVVELSGAWSSIVNPTREAMGTAHAKQSLALINKSIPRITSGCENAVVKATEAALFAKESGQVISVDEHEIVIQGEEQTISYPLDDIIMKSSTTDQRYRSIVSVGDKVKRKQCIADGPFTLQGELCMGATDLITAMIPFTALDDKKKGLFKGSNNNDALIISQSAAKKFEKKEITKIKAEITNRGWGSTDFTVPIVNGQPDERYDKETGLPKKGEVFHIGETVLVSAIPDSKQDYSVLEILASDDREYGKVLNEQKAKAMADLVVEDVRVAKDRATVYLSYTRVLECGDKITLGHGQKATVAAILPDEEMPTVEIKGKTIPVDIIPDPISFVKRGAPLTIEGTLRLALIANDEYAKVGVGEKNLPKVACNVADKSGLSIDSMYPVKLSHTISKENSYLSCFAQEPLQSIAGMDGLANKEAKAQQNVKDTNSADRMTGGAVLQSAEKAYNELFNKPIKVIKARKSLVL